MYFEFVTFTSEEKVASKENALIMQFEMFCYFMFGWSTYPTGHSFCSLQGWMMSLCQCDGLSSYYGLIQDQWYTAVLETYMTSQSDCFSFKLYC